MKKPAKPTKAAQKGTGNGTAGAGRGNRMPVPPGRTKTTAQQRATSRRKD